MQTSETINELAAALAKAQAHMQTARKGAENPHFRAKYADLAAVWEACRASLTANGLSVVQSPRMTFNGASGLVEVETRLLHSSGQWMADTITVPVSKLDAQGVGSAVTYARRYALAAFVSVAPDDDDGNGAFAGGPVEVPAPKGFDDWWADFTATADNGTAALTDAWKATSKAYRDYAQAKHRDALASLKTAAGKVAA